MTSAPTGTTPQARAFQALLGGGLVLLPFHPGYERGRVPWNLAVDQRPAAVAVASSAADVVAVVRAATAAGLRVVPQAGGHNAGPLTGRMDDAVLL
ncbi:MAG: FAD-binding protein, partial [Actinobacteria bacterium]|nr:FAD-binding protein [Actinomycetota bacterium]